MNLRNKYLVRVVNDIPFFNIVKPVANSHYIRKERDSVFYFAMSDLLKEKGELKAIDWSLGEEEFLKIAKENRNYVLENYMPYTSTYKSMSLWSINGLVPDDMNNTFSNKNCAIIESLEKQIGKANIVSLLPTDTSIRGDVFLSDESCVLIRKGLYESLSFEELVKLSVMNIKIFEGKIEKAINDELQNRGVVPQKLSLSREDQGYVKSPNSDQLINEIKEIANAYDIPQVLHFNIINGQNDYKEKFVWAKPEYDNIKIVETYFFVNFLSYLLIKYGDIIKLSIDPVLENPMNSNSMERLCQDLDRIGLDKYKEILHEYNEKIEMAINQNIFPTPEKIVESYRSGDPLTISRILENIEVKVK